MNKIKGKVIGTSYMDNFIIVLTTDKKIKRIKIGGFLKDYGYDFFDYIEDKNIQIKGFWYWKKIKILTEKDLK